MSKEIVFIGVGSNLPGPRHGTPLETCEAALASIAERGIKIVNLSRWYRCSPLPESDQPWYVNGVAAAETSLPPTELMEVLLEIEIGFGRRRSQPNAARIIDLDLLAYGARVGTRVQGGGAGGGAATVFLPHPRMHERAFVLLPLAELDPNWIHPVSGQGIKELIDALDAGQSATPL